jgi:hypothetical protein
MISLSEKKKKLIQSGVEEWVIMIDILSLLDRCISLFFSWVFSHGFSRNSNIFFLYSGGIYFIFRGVKGYQKPDLRQQHKSKKLPQFIRLAESQQTKQNS